jgi:hypothetical protein
MRYPETRPSRVLGLVAMLACGCTDLYTSRRLDASFELEEERAASFHATGSAHGNEALLFLRLHGAFVNHGATACRVAVYESVGELDPAELPTLQQEHPAPETLANGAELKMQSVLPRAIDGRLIERSVAVSLDDDDDEPEATWHLADVRVVFVACEDVDGSTPKIVFDGSLEFEASTYLGRPRLRQNVVREF